MQTAAYPSSSLTLSPPYKRKEIRNISTLESDQISQVSQLREKGQEGCFSFPPSAFFFFFYITLPTSCSLISLALKCCVGICSEVDRQ